MANKITGSTDTTGALQVTPVSPKSILLIGESDTGAAAETIHVITGTVDATTYFGADSPIVGMTRTLIQNGANNIRGIVVGAYSESGDPHTSVDDAYEAALTKSLDDDSIKVILLDTSSIPSLFTIVKAHLNMAEANDMFRYFVAGAPTGLNDNDLIALALTMGDKRIFLAGPNVVDGSNTEQDGIFTAAGIGARIMSETSDPALPMNTVQINGYAGVSRVLLRTQRDNLADNGVTALYYDGGAPTIWRLVTTYTTDPIWQEGTTIFIADDVLESVINRLKANYKRTKNVARILDSIRTDVIDVLQTKNGLEIIQNFDPTTVSVVRDPQDLYGALVDYEFQVVTPLYTITIKQHMRL